MGLYIYCDIFYSACWFDAKRMGWHGFGLGVSGLGHFSFTRFSSPLYNVFLRGVWDWGANTYIAWRI